MLQDTRTIGRLGGVEIGQQKQELQLRDGSMHQLHTVFSTGVPSKFLRALAVGGGRFSVFDVRRLAPCIDEDLRLAEPRDLVGIVLYTLRQKFAAGGGFLAAVDDMCHAIGKPAVAQAEPA